MNKIEIDVSFFKNFSKTGIGVYVDTLTDILKNHLKIPYSLFECEFPKFLRLKSIFYCIWLNTFLYMKTVLRNKEILFFPNFSMPFITSKKSKYFTVVHDLCAFRDFEMNTYDKFLIKSYIKTAAKKATTIITVSETVKQEIISKFNVSHEKIKVVHNAIAQYFINFEDNYNILMRYKVKDKKYILSVATLNKRKNIPELIKAFESISDKYSDLKLVLVGGMGNEQREKLTKHQNIIFTGYIPDEEIPVLYKHAMMYVFPSLYEGFGTPIVEAQYSKTPLLCSDIPVFREIAGDGAEFCSTDYIGIAEKIEYLINNHQRMEELIRLGSENVKRFDIKHIAEQLEKALV